MSGRPDPGAVERLVAQAVEQGHGRTVADPVTLARVASILTTNAQRPPGGGNPRAVQSTESAGQLEEVARA